MAAAGADLYRAQAVVTGRARRTASSALPRVWRTSSSRYPAHRSSPATVDWQRTNLNAKSFVKAFSYHDQFSGKPNRDEQGTRDRPYDLTVDFEEGKIDDILRALGLKPWLSHRPRLAVFVEMKQGPKNYIVTADGAQSDLQRDALLAAADRRGMGIVLPSAQALAKSNLNGVELKTVPSSTFAGVAAEQGGEVALVGQLVWDDRKLGWATQWQMDWHGRMHRWQVRGVTFDEAFRRGIGGAAQVLSGNGEPDGRARR